MADSRAPGVPVVPNAGRVRGRIVGTRPDPDGHGYVWDVAVEEAHAVRGLPNFVESYVGKTIEVYVSDDSGQSTQKATATARIDATVAFRGDERGGRFVLKQMHA